MDRNGIVQGKLVVTIDDGEEVIPLDVQEVELETESKQIPEL